MSESKPVVLDLASLREEHPPGYRLRRGRNWVFLGLTYASYYLCRYNLSPVAPELMSTLGLSKIQYGKINSGRDGAYAIGQMVNGLFTDRLGGKTAMTIGALSTVFLNLCFGLAAWSHVGGLLMILIAIRTLDGYMQAFGSPGFIKINTAWFKRKERGSFSGIFGFMINLGAIGAGTLAKVLVTGLTIPLIFFTLHTPALDWRYIFILPPMFVLVIILLMNLMVKNTPEEAGFKIDHDDEDDGDPNEKVRLLDVVRKIASNPTVWVVAGAYFCTGFVRRAVESWWAVYLDEVWHANKSSNLYWAFIIGLPVTASTGSLISGFISDKVFNGRRAPVAAVLYMGQFVLTCAALLVPHHGGPGAAVLAVSLLIGISMMCNSTHSILGTAAAMDLGGRKMAGCSSGIIDSFQYYGALLSGWGLGYLFEYVARVGPAPTLSGAETLTKSVASVQLSGALNPNVWLGSMLPFGFVGAALMTYLWIRHGKAGAKGA
jgi:OPA family glycerol-3-phosphate transporter-like MFS transporter